MRTAAEFYERGLDTGLREGGRKVGSVESFVVGASVPTARVVSDLDQSADEPSSENGDCTTYFYRLVSEGPRLR